MSPPYRVMDRTGNNDSWPQKLAGSPEYVLCHNHLLQRNFMVDLETLRIDAIMIGSMLVSFWNILNPRSIRDLVLRLRWMVSLMKYQPTLEDYCEFSIPNRRCLVPLPSTIMRSLTEQNGWFEAIFISWAVQIRGLCVSV